MICSAHLSPSPFLRWEMTIGKPGRSSGWITMSEGRTLILERATVSTMRKTRGIVDLEFCEGR